MENIQNISIWFIEGHPDNPRQDVGDVSELAESIKANGIMQNLTVVPWKDAHPRASKDDLELFHNHYTLIIGHRRFAAAKAAGLKEVPCAVADGLSYKEQIGIMMTENMQRSDLTIYEQAQGFQMMLDLGDTVKEVAEKTGFSETTVRKRVKLTELDSGKFKSACDRQISFMELDKLSQIEDIKVRNSVLDTTGTRNFENALSKALKEQETKKRLGNWLVLLEEYGFKEIPYNDCWTGKYTNEGYLTEDADESILKDMIVPGVNYYYAISYGSVYIRSDRKVAVSEEELKRKAEREERERINNAFSDLNRRFYEMRYNFIKGLSVKVIKEKQKEITEFILRALFSDVHSGYDVRSRICKLMEIETDSNLTGYSLISGYVGNCPEKALLYFAYESLNDNGRIGFNNYQNEFVADAHAALIYSFLEALGYEMSDEEVAYSRGTHKLFSGIEDEDDDFDEFIEDMEAFDDV